MDEHEEEKGEEDGEEKSRWAAPLLKLGTTLLGTCLTRASQRASFLPLIEPSLHHRVVQCNFVWLLSEVELRIAVSRKEHWSEAPSRCAPADGTGICDLDSFVTAFKLHQLSPRLPFSRLPSSDTPYQRPSSSLRCRTASHFHNHTLPPPKPTDR